MKLVEREFISSTAYFMYFQMWVQACRTGLMNIIVNRNNDVERQKRDKKNEYLKQYKDNKLGKMMTILTEQFLPILIQKVIHSILYSFLEEISSKETVNE